MSFFSKLDGFNLLEDHVKQLLGVEDDEADEILTIYKRVSETLFNRLQRARPGSFTEQSIRVALAQVDAGIQALNDRLLGRMPEAINTVANLSSTQLVEEMSFFEAEFQESLVPINVNALRVASKTENYLINQYQVSINTYSDSLRSKIVSGLQDSVAENISWDAITQRMMGFFGNEEWRLRRIVRTELHNIYGNAKLFGMEDLQGNQFPDLKKTLYHPLDRRTADDSQFLINNPLVVNVNEPFRYQWKGKWRVYMAPPDRPNDRSIMIPYRPAWN